MHLWKYNNNIKLEKPPKTDLELKISLVNQGVRIVDKTDFKKAVFSGIDFYIPSKDLYINAPLNVGLSNLSPYEIKKNGTSYRLYYYNTFMCEIEIEQDYSKIFKSNSNPKLKDILYISSDRIRIKPINGCDFKSNDEGCKFCELGFSKEHYSLKDIESAIIASKKLEFKHILIGGGTDLSKESWNNLKRIIKLVKKYYPNKSISLMSIPVPAKRLSVLKELGVSEVVFNIEIYDEKTAFDYMPGKRNYNFDLYYNTLKEAVTVFGCGNVRSAFIVGLESTDSLLEGVMKICNIGVLPCLSIYRCTNNSLNKLNPTNEFILQLSKIVFSTELPIQELLKNSILEKTQWLTKLLLKLLPIYFCRTSEMIFVFSKTHETKLLPVIAQLLKTKLLNCEPANAEFSILLSIKVILEKLFLFALCFIMLFFKAGLPFISNTISLFTKSSGYFLFND